MSTMEFENILNFRDLGGWVCEDGVMMTRPGVIFRSGTTGRATQADVQLLREKYQVWTILDFRELTAEVEKHVEESFPEVGQEELECSRPSRRRLVMVNGKVKRAIISAVGLTNLPRVMGIYCCRESFRFAKKVAMWAASRARVDSTLSLIRSQQRIWSLTLTIEWVSKARGFGNLYFIFCTRGKEAVFQALRICASEEKGAVLLHCNSGKDRTGIIAALILAAVGVPRDSIIEDYHKSHKFGLSVIHREKILLTPEEEWPAPDDFCTNVELQMMYGAPKECMEQFLKLLDDHYGSVEGYLDSIGFDITWRDRLKRKLLIPVDSGQRQGHIS